MKTEEFVAAENVKRLRCALEQGTDSARHAALLKRLVKEENRIGLTYEQLSEIERQIVRIKTIISQQIEAIETFKDNGYSLDEAERALARAVDMLSVHEVQREAIKAALAPALVSRNQPRTRGYSHRT